MKMGESLKVTNEAHGMVAYRKFTIHVTLRRIPSAFRKNTCGQQSSEACRVYSRYSVTLYN